MKMLVSLLLLLVGACGSLPRPTTTPIEMRVHDPSVEARELVVLLPGRRSLPSEFEREGFVDLVRESHPHARIVVPDLHLGYYRNRTAPDRLHHDIILPAKEEGLEPVTLVGISMGGLGAMIYELGHPDHADEIVLLSPFLGDDAVIEDIATQGGLAGWEPQGKEPDGFSRQLWQRLRESWPGRSDRPVLRLGCGESDRLASTSRLAEQELSPSQTLWLPGGHDWATWNALAARFFAESDCPGTEPVVGNSGE